MVYDTFCGKYYELRIYLCQIVWPQILVKADKILLVADFMDCDTICGRSFELKYYLWQINLCLQMLLDDIFKCCAYRVPFNFLARKSKSQYGIPRF